MQRQRSMYEAKTKNQENTMTREYKNKKANHKGKYQRPEMPRVDT